MSYDTIPTRCKETADGEKAKNHGVSCGGRCWVLYIEDGWYQVECEKCGTLVYFKARSWDMAIKIWNDMPDVVGM